MSRARSRLLGLALVVVTAVPALLIATTAGAHRTTPTAAVSSSAVCGSGAFFRLRTLSDATRNRVNFNSKDTTVTALAALKAPSPTPTSRTTGFERRVWQVVAQITSFRLEANGTIRLVLFQGSSYMNAEMPSPSCLSSTSLARKVIAATRRWFVANCGKPQASSQPLGASVRLNGVGFWAPKASGTGDAPNRAEIAPVIGIHPVAGCGAR
jgi:hypothetical protein